MSSPNMNNVILMGAMLAFTSIIFGGMDSNLVDESAHLIMCKVFTRVSCRKSQCCLLQGGPQN